MDNFDTVLTSIGAFGWYQKSRIFLIGAQLAFFSINGQFVMIMLLFVPEHSCGNDTGINLTLLDSADSRFNHSTLVNSVLDNGIGETFATYFGLMCDKAYYKSAILSACLVMMKVAIIGISAISDRFGRKKALLACAIFWTVCVGFAAFAASFWYSVVAFVAAASVGIGSYAVCSIMANEIVLPKRRTWTNSVMELGYSVYCGLLPAVFYGLGNWIVSTKLMFALGFLMSGLVLFLDESPRWLITMGQLENATKVLAKMALANKANVTIDDLLPQTKRLIELDQANLKSKHNGSFREVITLRHSIRKVVIFIAALTGLGGIQHGLQAGVQHIHMNPYLLFGVTNLASAPVCFLSIYIIDRIGHVRSYVLFTAIGATGCAVAGLLPDEYAYFAAVGAIVARALMSANYIVYFIVANEVFPTETRSKAHGVIRMVSGLVIATVPFLYLHLVEESGVKWVPFVVTSLVMLAGSAGMMFLPPTEGKHMVDTSQQSEIAFPVNAENFAMHLRCRKERVQRGEEAEQPFVEK